MLKLAFCCGEEERKGFFRPANCQPFKARASGEWNKLGRQIHVGEMVLGQEGNNHHLQLRVMLGWGV